MIYRLLFLAALLGIANAVESCYYCANPNAPPNSQVMGPKCHDKSLIKTCHASTLGAISTGQACVTRWTNQDLMGQGCIGKENGGLPDNATEFGVYKCKTVRSETICWCTTENCNKDTTFPANGADGKVGGVFSILLSAILATIF